MESRTLGMFLHEGRSTGESIIDQFTINTLKRIAKDANIFATTSDTTGNMNKFGMLLEEMGIIYPYCCDHNFHLTCKLKYDDRTFQEGVFDSLASMVGPCCCRTDPERTTERYGIRLCNCCQDVNNSAEGF